MGEILQFPKRPVEASEDSHVLQVRSGVFLASRVPSEALLVSGEFITAIHFANAAERVGRREQYGRNVLRVMALSMAMNEHVDAFAASVADPFNSALLSEQHMVTYINRITQDPRRVRQGSWSQLLLDPGLVRDTWAHENGSMLVRPRVLPRVSKAGYQVVSQIVAHMS